MGHITNPRSFRVSHQRKNRPLMAIPSFLDHKLQFWLQPYPKSLSADEKNLIGENNKKFLLSKKLKKRNIYKFSAWATTSSFSLLSYYKKIRNTLVYAHPSWNQLWFSHNSYASPFFSFYRGSKLFSSPRSFSRFFKFKTNKKRRVISSGFFSHSVTLAKANGQVFFKPIYVSKYLRHLSGYYPSYPQFVAQTIFKKDQSGYLSGSLLYERKSAFQPSITPKFYFKRTVKSALFRFKKISSGIRLYLTPYLTDYVPRLEMLASLKLPYRPVLGTKNNKVMIKMGRGYFDRKYIPVDKSVNPKFFKMDAIFFAIATQLGKTIRHPHRFFSSNMLRLQAREIVFRRLQKSRKINKFLPLTLENDLLLKEEEEAFFTI